MENKEVEIRFEISPEERSELLKKLNDKGWQGQTIKQKDTYFGEAEKVSAKVNPLPYIVRLRESEKPKLALKYFVEGGSWVEIESGIDNPSAMRQILDKIDQKEFLIISKDRISGKMGAIEINIDSVEGLGEFVELEIMDLDVESGRTKLMDFAKEINLPTERVVTRGYVQLMQEA